MIDFLIAPQGAGIGIKGFASIPEKISAFLPNQIVIEPEEISYTDNSNLKNLNNVIGYSNKLAQEVYNSLENGHFPFTIGGDHSIALGTISGAAKKYDNLGVIWIDAHGDMNTDETTISGRIHGMILSSLQGLGDKRLVNVFQEKQKIKTENIVIYGTRDLDVLEEQLMKDVGVKYIPYSKIKKEGILNTLEDAIQYLKSKTNDLHISFDLDSMNPEIVPGVSTPVKDGFNLRDSFLIFKELFNASFNITSFDLVEYNPLFDKKDMTQKVILRICNFVSRIK
ncbi:MAG: arginase [Bacilli bacterium]|jgi:ornithine decarboxylase